MSSAHDKIFGEKFSSLERFELIRLHTVGYCDFLTKCYEIRLAKEPFFDAIVPLLHSNTVAVGTQKSLFCAPIAALSECKRGSIVKHGCCLHGKTPKKQQT